MEQMTLLNLEVTDKILREHICKGEGVTTGNEVELTKILSGRIAAMVLARC